MSRTLTRRSALMLSVSAVLATAGCADAVPRDSQGTLERAEGGRLFVGAAENPPWTEIADDGGVGGLEADIIADYAASIDATVEWTTGGMNELARTMKNNELDLVIGGLTADTPWSDKISPTRPYQVVRAEDGSKQKMVIGVRPGENALQVSLERFLAKRTGEL
ncbi:transporter substrate-binding domain-containing protein [Brachybacterium sp. ACRRE]|uniref:transporter substrate-binding domain-containing protein n=1 Tax=Brachybacterium sp. ACRRE TaxID=2918184 RepID=UPI001EF1DDB0|nr:transporter substrate-binding domain-containing protein [Brachybacterium sp. ACRRE]MCG7309434.1 ABC transporter substrate-binding protein [Brachybacterium sp. ACRRE]